MFEDQNEYDSFMAWAIEGSCLAQRMLESVPGGHFEIPLYWEKHKEMAKGRMMPDELPDRLKQDA
jgi:hypothetical protein